MTGVKLANGTQSSAYGSKHVGRLMLGLFLISAALVNFVEGGKLDWRILASCPPSTDFVRVRSFADWIRCEPVLFANLASFQVANHRWFRTDATRGYRFDLTRRVKDHALRAYVDLDCDLCRD